MSVRMFIIANEQIQVLWRLVFIQFRRECKIRVENC